MNNSQKKEIIEALKNQKEIFGDELFGETVIKRKTKTTVNNNAISMREANDNNFKVAGEIRIEKKEEDNFFSKPKDAWETTDNLDMLNKLICNCQRCQLGSTRNKFVFGSGKPDADVMTIGEGPGADEDAQGLPFVGRAGKLLTDILKAIKFSRDEVYIANIVKCRPPGNRTPYPQEMETCMPYLLKQIELIKPKVILCLGLTAAQGLLKKKESLTNMRGKIFDFEISDAPKIKVMVTYHPAALLRNPNWKRGCWEDVQKFRKLYDELV